MYRLLGLPRRAAAELLDVVLPPRCPACREIVPADGVFCAACWRQIDYLTEPVCACCGRPFPYDVGKDAICGDCAATPPPYRTARAAVAYNDASAGLVLGLKYGDRTHLARIMAGMMARVAANPLASGALVVPVPLHPRRMRRRLFNQAALLARALAKGTNAEVGLDILHRRRDTPPTRGMSRVQRARNVAGAFRVMPKAKARLAGRNVLLVDDVMTTGATVEACARALLRAGSPIVDIVTFARVTNYDGKSAT